MLKLRLLDRYIAVEILKPFFGSCVLFSFLLVMFQILRLSDFLVVHQAPLEIVIKLAFFLVLSISSYVVPIAFLSSVLIAFGRLSSDSELIAMKSCGQSVTQISKPALKVAGAACVLTLILTLHLGPSSEQKFNEILSKTGNTQVAAVLKEGMFNAGFFDLLLFADKIDGNKGEMRKVFIYDEREKNFPMVVVASEGKIDNLAAKGSLGGQVLLRLFNGHTYQIDSKDLTSQVGSFEEYELYLKIDEAGTGSFSEARMLTLSTLLSRMQNLPKHLRPYIDYKVEIWKRIYLSLSPLVFCILGIGLGIVRTRAIQSRGVMITLVTVAVYWQTLVYSTEKVLSSQWPIPIGTLTPNLVVLIIAAWFYRRVM